MAIRRNINNNMTGSMFKANSPNADLIFRGFLNIEGATVEFAVYTPKVSTKGREYYPVSLRYNRHTNSTLRAVPVEPYDDSQDAGGNW